MRRRLTRDHWIDVGIVGAVLLPVVVMTFRFALGAPNDFLSTGDISLAELRVREIDRLPLLGPYSRWEVFHPGPAMFYLLAPGYWLTGGTRVSIHLAAAGVNLAVLAATLAVARAVGGRALLLLTGGGLLLLMAGMGVDRLVSAWNPSTNVPLLVLVLLSAWWLAAGGRWALPVLLGAGTVAVQTHYGYALVVAAVVATAVAAMAVRRDRAAAVDRRPVITTVAVLALLWTPPLLQQVAGPGPANLTGVIRANAQNDLPTLGAAEAARIAGRHFGVLPEWALAEMGPGLRDEYGADRGPLKAPLLVLVLVAAAVAARRRRERGDAAAAVAVLVAIVASLASLALVRGPLFPWLTWFLGPVAMVGWLVAAWCLIPRRYAAAGGAVVLVAGAFFALLGAGATDVGALRTEAGLDSDRPVAVTAARFAAALPDERVSVDAADADWGDLVETTALALSRAGKDVRVSRELAHPFGHELRDDGDAPRTRLIFIRDGSPTAPPPDAQVAARTGGYVIYRR